MRNIFPYTLWTAIGLLLAALSAQAEPLLNGLALHQELGKDQFIGAIYSETLTSTASVLMTAEDPLRMELKITAERGIRTRSFNRMWIEGIAINNGNSALSAQADNMVAFTNLFQGRLRQNDHLVFSSTPTDGIDFFINGIKLGNISDNSFMAMLLSAWIGRVPLSSSYQENLLSAGSINGDLSSRFDLIAPTAARTQQVAAWGATPPIQPPVVAAARPSLPQPTPEPITAATPDISIGLPTLATADEETTAADEPIPEPIETPTVVEDLTVAVVSDEVFDDEEDESSVPAFTVESLLANQRYFSRIVRLVQSKIVYPRRAQQRGYEGSLRIAISLGRNGELLDTAFLEETRHSSLNKAAMKAIQRSSFPTIPAEIQGSTHDFTIPIKFAF